MFRVLILMIAWVCAFLLAACSNGSGGGGNKAPTTAANNLPPGANNQPFGDNFDSDHAALSSGPRLTGGSAYSGKISKSETGNGPIDPENLSAFDPDCDSHTIPMPDSCDVRSHLSDPVVHAAGLEGNDSFADNDPPASSSAPLGGAALDATGPLSGASAPAGASTDTPQPPADPGAAAGATPPVDTNAAPGAAPAAPSTEPTKTQPAAETLLAIVDANDPRWTPGLFGTEPSNDPNLTTIFTNSNGLHYTDSKPDNWIQYYNNSFINKDNTANPGNDALSGQISNVIVSRDVGDQKEFQVMLEIAEDGNTAQPAHVILHGTLGKTNLTKRFPTRSAHLVTTDIPGVTPTKYLYAGALICIDDSADLGCQNISIQLNRFNQSGRNPSAAAATTPAAAATVAAVKKPAAAAVKKVAKEQTPIGRTAILYRLSDTMLTLPSSSSGKSSELESYLAASFQNSCLVQKAHETDPSCQAAFDQLCAGDPKALVPSGAKRVLLETWAVARGRAKFQLIFQNDEEDIWATLNGVTISGELVAAAEGAEMQPSAATPEWHSDKGDHSTEPSWINSGHVAGQLMANDGAGHLNIKIDAGNGGSAIRFSVNGSFPNTLPPPGFKKNDAKAPICKFNQQIDESRS